jgi:hypothetical protein
VTKHNIKYQRPSPPNTVRLSDDKRVIFVEWPNKDTLQDAWFFLFDISRSQKSEFKKVLLVAGFHTVGVWGGITPGMNLTWGDIAPST